MSSMFDADAMGGSLPELPKYKLNDGFAPSVEMKIRHAGGDTDGGGSISHHKDQRPAPDILREFAEMVEGEKRKDFAVAMADVRVQGDGRIYVNADNPFALEKEAFGQFMSLIPDTARGAAGYLKDCPVGQRVPHVQYWLGQFRNAERAEKTAFDAKQMEQLNAAVEAGNGEVCTFKPKEFQPKRMQLRMRNGAGPERVYGVTGERYPHPDANRVARLIAGLVPDNAQVQYCYNGYKTSMKLWWPVTEVIEGAEDITGQGFHLRTSDVATGAQSVRFFCTQNFCTNGLMVCVGPEVKLSDRHAGTTESMLEKLTEKIMTAVGYFPNFIQSWVAAKAEQVLDETTNVRDVFESLVKSKRITVPGFTSKVGKTEVVEALVEAYASNRSSRSPIGSKAKVIDAVTYTAHTYNWRTDSPGARWMIEETMQEQAGQLVHVRLAN